MVCIETSPLRSAKRRFQHRVRGGRRVWVPRGLFHTRGVMIMPCMQPCIYQVVLNSLCFWILTTILFGPGNKFGKSRNSIHFKTKLPCSPPHYLFSHSIALISLPPQNPDIPLIVCNNKDIISIFFWWTSNANQIVILRKSGDCGHGLRKIIHIWYLFTYKERIPLNDRNTLFSSTDTLLPESTLKKNLKRQKRTTKLRKVLN